MNNFPPERPPDDDSAENFLKTIRERIKRRQEKKAAKKTLIEEVPMETETEDDTILEAEDLADAYEDVDEEENLLPRRGTMKKILRKKANAVRKRIIDRKLYSALLMMKKVPGFNKSLAKLLHKVVSEESHETCKKLGSEEEKITWTVFWKIMM